MIGVELFAGAGGMSIGAKLAGIDIKLAVEFDSHAAETFRRNNPEIELYDKDIRTLKAIDVDNSKGESVLFGGPPCQGFSTSNQRNRTKKNEKNWLYLEFVRLLEQWKPTWVVLENVQGLMETENGLFLNEIITDFSNLGYKVRHKVLNASNFGVPQKRNRIFIIGSISGVDFEFPEGCLSTPISVQDAISDLPLLKNGSKNCILPYRCPATSNYAKSLRNGAKTVKNNLVTKNSQLVVERYKHIPQGGNWQNIPDDLMKNYADTSRCHTGIYKRLKIEEPSVVIGNYRKNMLIHPIQNRGLSVREAARLQSFPDNYEFHGGIGFQQQQVGNAVPPLLAKAIFNEIIENN